MAKTVTTETCSKCGGSEYIGTVPCSQCWESSLVTTTNKTETERRLEYLYGQNPYITGRYGHYSNELYRIQDKIRRLEGRR